MLRVHMIVVAYAQYIIASSRIDTLFGHNRLGHTLFLRDACCWLFKAFNYKEWSSRQASWPWAITDSFISQLLPSWFGCWSYHHLTLSERALIYLQNWEADMVRIYLRANWVDCTRPQNLEKSWAAIYKITMVLPLWVQSKWSYHTTATGVRLNTAHSSGKKCVAWA